MRHKRKRGEVSVIGKKILCELMEARKELKRCADNSDIIIKRISVLHNSKNIKNSKPLAWLTPEQRVKSNKLKKENPETYKYVTEVLALFVGGD